MSAALVKSELKKRLPKILANDADNGPDMYPTILELVMEDVEESPPTTPEELTNAVRVVLVDDFEANVDEKAFDKFVAAVFPQVEEVGTSRTAAARKKKQEAAARKAERQALEAEILAAEGKATEVDSDDEAGPSGGAPVGEDIIIEGFNIFMGGKQLYRNASITLAKGNRYGLVGPNGVGKTTLLNHIASRSGDFQIPAHIDTLLVEQEIEFNDLPAIEFVVRADKRRLKYLARKEELEAKLEGMADGRAADALSDQLNAVYEKLQDMGSDAAEARASAILSGLQFTEDMKLAPTTSFSGGWRMRISLARALFIEPRLLLLDEPTNHMDLHAVLWLEEYLQSYKHTLLIVSHDRDFLATVTTHCYHVWDMNLTLYRGNYDVFETRFAAFIEEHNAAIVAKDKRVAKAKRSGKYVPQEGDDAKKIQIKQIELKFDEPTLINSTLVSVTDMSFGYPGRDLLFDDVSFGISTTSRIALVGPNGTGKSTLLKLVTGDLEPTAGTIERARKLRIAVFNQHFVDQLDLTVTPIEYLRTKFPKRNVQQIRQYLGMYGLNGDQHKQIISTLSGGQKSRVVFVEISFSAPHVIILDEPTNNLDLETIDALTIALSKFEGAVVLVTHSPSLISGACNEVWICDHERKVNVYPGTFDEYRADLLYEMQELLKQMDDEAAARSAGRPSKSKAKSSKNSAPAADAPLAIEGPDPFGDAAAAAAWVPDLEAFATLHAALPDLAKRPGMVRFAPFTPDASPDLFDALDAAFSWSKLTLAFMGEAPKKKRRKKKKKDADADDAPDTPTLTWSVSAFVLVPAAEWYARVSPKPKAVLKYLDKVLGGFFGVDPARIAAAPFINELAVSKMTKSISVCPSTLAGDSECRAFLKTIGDCDVASECSAAHVRGHEGIAGSMLCTANMAAEDGCAVRGCPFSHSLKGGRRRGGWFANSAATAVVDGDGWAVTCEPANVPGDRKRQLYLTVGDGTAPARSLLAVPATQSAIQAAIAALGLAFATVWVESASDTSFVLVPEAADWDALLAAFPAIAHLGAPRHEHEFWHAAFLARHPDIVPFYDDDDDE